ncbi:MAG: hypothetical protein JST28_19600 [Acidobacteria bacterium]|nr:hypothetical protein [Acidobacteriota bacterium]
MSHSAPIDSTDDSARTFLMVATDKQRTTFSKWMDATERLSTAIDPMADTGSSWSRGRASYNQQDLHKFPGREEQFESALSTMIAYQGSEKS